MSKKQKINLIEELTTHKSDFQFWPISHTPPYTGARSRYEPVRKPPPPNIQIDPQSHSPYRPSAHIPFDLYIAPKPIVATDPRECFNTEKPCDYSTTYERTEIPTTLFPALQIGQIKDKRIYKKIIDFTYTGMQKKLMEESALRMSQRPDPPQRVVPEGHNIKFKPTVFAQLPPGWITAATHWDCLQSRNLGDPFRTFWTRRGPEVECGCCCNPLPNMLSKETKDEISTLTCENKLRLPYDVTKTGYGGYRQNCAKGVPLDKSNPPRQEIYPTNRFLR